MSFQEIWKVIEDSQHPYTVKGEASGTYTNEVWPVGEEPNPAFRIVKGKNGRRAVQLLEGLPKAAQAQLSAAEAAFKARDFEAAEKGYAALLKSQPAHFPAHLFLGDALLFGGKAGEALASYERAAKAAPWSYTPWFFQASALIRLERFEEAGDRYARALSLRPSWPAILTAIESNGRHIGMKVQPLLLKPTARAFRSGEGVVVEADEESPAWLSHALCKAMWLGEPEMRKKRTGKAAHEFTMLEETECLAVLLASHQSMREEKPDPDLDRVMAIAEDGYLSQLILYELASRVAPMAIPTLDEEQLAKLHAYVKKYVLVPTAKASAAP